MKLTIPDCWMQENELHKPWRSNQCLAERGLAGIHQNPAQDFDLDQVQRKEGLVHFHSLANLLPRVLPCCGLYLSLDMESHQLQRLLSRNKNH